MLKSIKMGLLCFCVINLSVACSSEDQVSLMKHRDRIPVTVVMRTKVVKKRHLPKRVMPFRVLTVQVVILPAEQAEMYI